MELNRFLKRAGTIKAKSLYSLSNQIRFFHLLVMVKNMKSKKNLNRREFLTQAAATAATFSIVPSHVIAGSGKVPPSDKITVANIGCGTQGLREMAGMLQHPNIQVVAVCDPNKFSTDYLDWSPHGIRDGIRRTIGDPNWGGNIKGIPGGREGGGVFGR